VLQREGLYRRLLALSDVLVAGLALLLAVTVLGDDGFRLTAILALPTVVGVSKLVGLYDRDELVVCKTTLDEAPALFQLATLYTLLIWVLEGELTIGRLEKIQVLALWALLFAGFLVARTLARLLARTVAPVERCMVIGDRTALARVRSKLRDESANAVVVAHIEVKPTGETPGDRELEPDAGDIVWLASAHHIHRVIVASDTTDRDNLLEIVGTVKELGIRVSVLPSMFEVVGSSVEFDRLGGMTLLGVRRFGLTRSSAALKRAFDLVAASLTLILLAPLMAVVALVIRLDSPGRALFRQTRIGHNGRAFAMLKFRTMVEGADGRKDDLRALNEAVGLFKIAYDPRATRIGRFLRRTALDELPQLWNVLRGDMSLVGPRPLVVDEDERVEGWHRSRLQLMPGMTGDWQVLGPARVPLEEMLTIDYLYAANWSLWADVKILFRTVPHVVGRRGV